MIRFDYRPHPGQVLLHKCPARFQTVCCGRRWGKTKFAAAKLLDEGGVVPGDYGWIAPTYLIADRGVEALEKIGGEGVKFSGKNPIVAEFMGQNGKAKIYFLSSEKPKSILGFGFRGIVVDETAQIPKAVWTTYIRPTLSDHMGWATLISTPRAKNWFYEEFMRKGQPGHASFTFPSNSNPFFAAEEWEEAKRTLPSAVFEQEYEAKFLENGEGVFRGVDGCVVEETRQTGRIIIGIDLAKMNDFVVLIAMDESGAVLDMERFNRLDWKIVKQRIREFCAKWGGEAWMEVNNQGGPIYDDLREEIPNLRAWITTHGTKETAIQQLSMDVEQGKICWPRRLEVLTEEMKIFQFGFTEKNTMVYGAPEGFHDDTVMALAIANVNRPRTWKWKSEPKVFSSRSNMDGYSFSGRRLGSKARLEVC